MTEHVGPGALAALVEHNADGILIVDADGVVRFANPAAAALFGRPAEALVGGEFGLPLVPGDAAGMDLVRPVAGPVAVEARLAPIEWDGAPAHVVTLRDVAERRRAEARERELIRQAAAREEAERAAAHAEFLAAAGAALVESLHGETALRRAAELAVPFLADYVLVHLLRDGGEVEIAVAVHHDPGGQRVLDGLRRDYRADPGDPASPLARVLREGRTEWSARVPEPLAARFAADSVFGADFRRLRPASFVIVPLAVRDRRFGALTVTRAEGRPEFGPVEVTLAEELARRASLALDNARLLRVSQQANRAKSQFLATMSHEIRTPINAVIGYADLLDAGIGGALSEKQQEYVGRIQASSRHLLTLVNDVLDLSKIEAGETTTRAEPVPALQTARDAMALVAPQLEARAVALVLEDGCAADTALRGDPDRVRQILVNLLSNAAKFTEPGGQVTVRCVAPRAAALGTGQEGEWVRLEVEDTGVGIAAEQLEIVFEPFVQVDGGYTRPQGGTGLGLAISRRLARLMGGDLSVDSEPGRGSCFALHLPLAEGAAAAAVDPADDARTASQPAPARVLRGEVPGLGDLAARLAAAADDVTARLAARLRAELDVAGIERMPRVQVEDHLATYLVDLAQTLSTLDEAGEEPDLLRDGTQIRRLLAWKHADQRLRLGWTRGQMEQEHALLRQEVEAVLWPDGAAEWGRARELLLRLLEEGEEVAMSRFGGTPATMRA